MVRQVVGDRRRQLGGGGVLHGFGGGDGVALVGRDGPPAERPDEAVRARLAEQQTAGRVR
ncbi:hypothetical protein H7X46_03090 [Pseudonocardia sp. C8]|uniref:hypothetical protein n=1 Tax=Pseudonocardia sp. C8 TaxID=2762759 RepID=UPI0016433C26|nr:hypothetical protein [Pseudonocardia sp. C8]MBC3190047.1 hypothetical protein [Pseudonocardia sp. C8]